ncbi:MAG TPA: hypothetical protein VID04_17185 [Methylomirabilota bacterium]|jgi:hypothetical protein
MRARVDIDTASGLAVLADSGLPITPPALASPAFKRYFRELSEQKKLFYLDGEDPSKFRLLICVDDLPGDLPKHRFSPLSGSFFLPLPSGRLSVSAHAQPDGATELQVAPGNYSVSVFGVAPGEIDGAAFQAEQFKLLGDRDQRYRQWVDRLGLVGIIPFGFALIVIMVYRFSIVSLIAAAIGLASVLPRVLIARRPRYLEIERRLQAHEASFPHFVLDLRRVETATGLVGGHFVV